MPPLPGEEAPSDPPWGGVAGCLGSAIMMIQMWCESRLTQCNVDDVNRRDGGRACACAMGTVGEGQRMQGMGR